VYADPIIAEIHQAITNAADRLSLPLQTRPSARSAGLGAEVDLRSIIDSWGDTLPDEQILHLLRNWNAGLPLCHTVYASKPQDDDYDAGRETGDILRECDEPLTQHVRRGSAKPNPK